MELLLINPNSTASMTARLAEAARAASRPDTTITAATIEQSPASIDGYADEAVAAAGVARHVREHGGGADAIVVACFGDPGLFAARELADVPVVGIAEASFALAMSLGHRFGIVDTVDGATPSSIDLLRRYGLESRCAAIEASEAEVLELNEDPVGMVAALEVAGRRAVRAGAEVLCLGCAAMLGVRPQLEARLGVPIVEAVAAGVALAESLVGLGLTTSKIRAFRAASPAIR